MLTHVVFSTKKRSPDIREHFRDDLYAYIGGIVRGENALLVAIGGTINHVHMVVKTKPATGRRRRSTTTFLSPRSARNNRRMCPMSTA